MDTPCFELTQWTDLLDKSKSDLSRLEKAVNSYDVFNCLCTVDHITDWIEKGEKNGAVRKAADRLKKQSTNVRTVHALCNLAKHFTLADTAKQPNTDVKKGYGMGRYGVGEYGVGEPSYLVEIDGKMLTVLDLLRDAISEWEAVRMSATK